MVGCDRKSLAMCSLTVIYINTRARRLDRIATFFLFILFFFILFGTSFLNGRIIIYVHVGGFTIIIKPRHTCEGLW